jgi:hypothetical protein
MSVKNVYHRTRDRIFKMNFSADGETSWSFTSESDGEIYAVESNNIAGYTINGEPVTLPYTITAGSSYAVSVTKTTEGKTADITIKSRRVTEKTTTLNVPDYGDNTINRVFILSANGTVYIFDKSKLNQSNYSGAGSFTEDPLIQTINLPTVVYSDQKYCMPTFSDNFLYCFLSRTTGVSGNGQLYACKINLDTYQVTDLDLNADSLTLLSGETGIISQNALIPPIHCYDYVNNMIYGSRPHFNGSFVIDIKSKSVRSANNVFAFGKYNEAYRFHSYYDPINSLFQTFNTGANENINPRVIRSGNTNSLITYPLLFDISRNSILKHTAYWGRLSEYNQHGAHISYDPSSLTETGGTPFLSDGKNNILFMNDDSEDIRFQPVYSNQTNYVQTTVANIHSSHSHFKNAMMVSETGKLAALLSDSGRIHFFEYDNTTPSVFQMYFDLNDTDVEMIQIDNKLIFP